MTENQVLEHNAKVYFESEIRLRRIERVLNSPVGERMKPKLDRDKITYQRRFKCAGKLIEDHFLSREDLLPILNQNQITLP